MNLEQLAYRFVNLEIKQMHTRGVETSSANCVVSMQDMEETGNIGADLAIKRWNATKVSTNN